MIKQTGWITDGSALLRNIARDNGSKADNGVIAYCYTGKDDGTPTDPNIRFDYDWASKFKHPSALIWITRMVGSQNLNAGTDLRLINDCDLNYVQDAAVEVQKDAAPVFTFTPAENSRSYIGQVHRVGFMLTLGHDPAYRGEDYSVEGRGTLS